MGVFNSWDECKVQVDGFLDARYKGFTSLAEAEAWIALNSTDNVISGHQTINKPKKIYLNIPYCEKDEGKKLGTKWDPKKKKWYIFSNSNKMPKTKSSHVYTTSNTKQSRLNNAYFTASSPSNS